MLPTYSGIRTFLRAPFNPLPVSSIAVIGMPYDCGTSNRSGARFGPAAIREMSLTFDADRDPQYPSRKMMGRIVDCGDFDTAKIDPHTNYEFLLRELLMRGNFPLIMGGDHSISLVALRALKWLHEEPIAVIHFDAHADTWPYEGAINHGNFMTWALTENLVRTDLSIQIGLRTEAPETSISQVYSYDFEECYDSIVMKFKEIRKSRVPTYLTFDVDVFDPAYAPGTGTPVSGGLEPRMVYKLMREMKGINWCGMDVVEVCPAYDHANITALAAATVMHQFTQIVLFSS